MSTTSRKLKDQYRFALLGWPAATAPTGVEYVCARHMEASSWALWCGALRCGFHARALLDIPGTSWLAMLRAVLGKPDPGLTRVAGGRRILLRLLIGEPAQDLLADGAGPASRPLSRS